MSFKKLNLEINDILVYKIDNIVYSGRVILHETTTIEELLDRGIVTSSKHKYLICDSSDGSISELYDNSSVEIIELIKKEKYVY